MGKGRKTRKIKISFATLIRAVGVILIFAYFQNCGPVNFNHLEPPPLVTPNGNHNPVLNTIQPALASRATGCIMCHGTFSSNIITDFGYGGDGKGLDYFFGGKPGSTLPAGLTNEGGGSVYGDYDFNTGGNTNWGAAHFAADTHIVVPVAPTTGLNVQKPSLAEYLRWIIGMGPSAATATVDEVSSVFIGAPTAQKILSASGVTAGGIKYFKSWMGGPNLAGFQLQNGYYTNTAQFVCEGDVVVDGIVWLNEVHLRTDKGCRIYATKSIFVSGGVTYDQATPDSNLELSSSKMVALGIGYATKPGGTNSVAVRLNFDGDGRWKGFFTRELGAPLDLINSLRADAEVIGPTLPDATCTTGGRAIGFDHLLVNAPVIESRYQGRFNGVIIGELTLLSLNVVDYAFDPIFLKVPILPLLENSDFLGLIR